MYPQNVNGLTGDAFIVFGHLCDKCEYSGLGQDASCYPSGNEDSRIPENSHFAMRNESYAKKEGEILLLLALSWAVIRKWKIGNRKEFSVFSN